MVLEIVNTILNGCFQLLNKRLDLIGFSHRTKYPLYPIINEAKVRILQYYA